MTCQRGSGKRYIISLPHYEYQHGTGAKILSVKPDYNNVILTFVTFFKNSV